MNYLSTMGVFRTLSKDWKRDIIILILLQVLLGLIYLKSVPRFFQDEAVESSFGYSLAYEGRLRHPIIEGLGGVHIHFLQNRLILPMVCAVIYRLIGFSILTSRLSSVLVSVIAIINIYGVMRYFFGHRQAFFIAAATILYPWFFEISRRVRPEIYYIALGMGAWWCLVYSLHKQKKLTAFLAGLLAGLTGLTHPTGFVLGFALFLAVLIWQWSQHNKKVFLWIGVGFMVALLPYVFYVLWCIQDPRIDFSEQMLVSGLQRAILKSEILRWRYFLQWPSGAPLAVILVFSLFYALYRSTSYDKIIATAIIIYSIILPFATVNATSRYLVALAPLFCALVVRFVFRVTKSIHGQKLVFYKYRFIVTVAIIAIYMAISGIAISRMIFSLRGADFSKVLDRVSSVLDRKALVYGEMVFFMERDRFRYGPYPMEFRDGASYQDIEMVSKYRFDYAIRTAWLMASSHGIASPPIDMPAFRPWWIIDQVCERFGTKIYEFRDPYFGPVEVYKLNWENSN